MLHSIALGLMIITVHKFKMPPPTKSDRYRTPAEYVDQIAPFLPRDCVMWEPFDTPQHAISTRLHVLRPDITFVQHGLEYDGRDAFTDLSSGSSSRPMEATVIVSNPPFSEKDRLLELLYAQSLPWAMLMPLHVLEGKRTRMPLFREHGVEVLILSRRGYLHPDTCEQLPSSRAGSCWLCKGILPSSLMFEHVTCRDDVT